MKDEFSEKIEILHKNYKKLKMIFSIELCVYVVAILNMIFFNSGAFGYVLVLFWPLIITVFVSLARMIVKSSKQLESYKELENSIKSDENLKEVVMKMKKQGELGVAIGNFLNLTFMWILYAHPLILIIVGVIVFKIMLSNKRIKEEIQPDIEKIKSL